MNKHKILFFVIVLIFVFFFGFLATYSHNKITEQSTKPPEGTATTIQTESNPIPTETAPTPNVHNFGTSFTLRINSSITFSDGLVVTLKQINDSRCPKDAQCVWAGELGAVLIASGGKLNSEREVRLGTVTNRNNTIDGAPYRLTLQAATETTVTVTVFN